MTAVSCVLAVAGIVLFAVKLMYVPLIISVAVALHGFYGTPFYFRSYANLKLKIKVLECREQNPDATLEEISEKTGVKAEVCRTLLKK